MKSKLELKTRVLEPDLKYVTAYKMRSVTMLFLQLMQYHDLM